VLAGQVGGAVGVAGRDGAQQRDVLLHVARHHRDPVQHQAPDARGQVVVADQGVAQVRVARRVVDGAVDAEVRPDEVPRRCRLGVQGRQWAVFEEPKMTTVGALTAAAIWAMPLSLPTNTRARDSSAVISGKVKSVRAATGVAVLPFNSSITDFSFGVVIAITAKPLLLKSSAKRPNLSAAHCLVANAAAG